MSKISELKKANNELKSLKGKLDNFLFKDAPKLRNKQNDRTGEMRRLIDEARKFNNNYKKLAEELGFGTPKDSQNLTNAINKVVKPLNAFIKNTLNSLGR